MYDESWLIVDTESDGLMTPIHVVEIAAQKMRGWRRDGEPFRVLLNHDVPIDPTAEAVHGYSREYLRKHGVNPREAHAAFRAYAGDLPMVAYNLSFDWNRALEPEYARLGLPVAGRRGFCAMTLSRRVIQGTANYKLETLKEHFGLNGERSHQGRQDVETLAALFERILAPKIYQAGIFGFDAVTEFSRRTPVAICLELIHGDSEPCWYFLDPQSNSHGPFSVRGLRQALADTSAYVWREGMAEWALSSELPEFAPAEESKKRKPRKQREPRSTTPVPTADNFSDAALQSAHVADDETSAAMHKAKSEPSPLPAPRDGLGVNQVDASVHRRWIDELVGLSKGILADGKVTEEETIYLARWLMECPCTHLFPVNVITAEIEKIIADDVIEEHELLDLRDALESILPSIK